jgi:hypothetical protein
VGRHARDLPRVVGLDTSDRDERVAPLGQRLRYEVLELSRLVAPEGNARVAVLALGPDLHPAAEVRAQAGQGMDRRRAERERVALEVVEAHRPTPLPTATAAGRCRSSSPA